MTIISFRTVPSSVMKVASYPIHCSSRFSCSRTAFVVDLSRSVKVSQFHPNHAVIRLPMTDSEMGSILFSGCGL